MERVLIALQYRNNSLFINVYSPPTTTISHRASLWTSLVVWVVEGNNFMDSVCVLQHHIWDDIWFIVQLLARLCLKMPRIENDIKLDFKDVLLRPKRSTLKSRSEVSAFL